MKYINYYFRMFKMSLMDQLANRANFVVWAVINIFSVLTYLVFFRIIFSGISSINGWSENQVLTVFGTGLLIRGLGSMTFFTFMYFFGDDVVKGNFDFKMLKPINLRFLTAIPYVDLEDITMIPLAIIVLTYAVSSPSLFGISLYLILVACALIFLLSFITLIESLAFRAVKINSSYNFVWSIISTANYPMKPVVNVFPSLLVFLFPMVMISSVPAEVLFGRYEWNWIVASVVSAITLFIISRWVWQRALLDYSSASS